MVVSPYALWYTSLSDLAWTVNWWIRIDKSLCVWGVHTYRHTHAECVPIWGAVMSDVPCIRSFQCNYMEIPESAVPEDLCHSRAPTPTNNDSLEPPVARQHNAGASYHSPSPCSTMAGPGASACQSDRLRLPLRRARGSAADMSLTSSNWAQRKPVGRLCSLEPDGSRHFVSVLYGRKRHQLSN